MEWIQLYTSRVRFLKAKEEVERPEDLEVQVPT